MGNPTTPDTIRFTADESALAQAAAIFIAVPSPLGRKREPDLSFIEAAATKSKAA